MAWQRTETFEGTVKGMPVEVTTDVYCRAETFELYRKRLVVTWNVYASEQAYRDDKPPLGQVRLDIEEPIAPVPAELDDDGNVVVPGVPARPGFEEIMADEAVSRAISLIKAKIYAMSRHLMPEFADAIEV